MLEVGTPAPSMRFRDADGNIYTNAEFAGTALVVAFYPNAFTGGCERELREFNELYDEFRKAGAEVLGSSVDTQFAQGAFAAQMELKFKLVSDWPRYRTSTAFEVYPPDRGWDDRVTYVIDREGIIRFALHDENDMTRHARESLEAVRAL